MKTKQEIMLAENLKHLMAERRLSLTATAKKVGMNKSTLHNYCHGVVPRNLLKIKELAELLDVSLSELIFGKNQEAISLPAIADVEGKYEVTIKRVNHVEKR